jgi:hypothetical protein
MNKRIEEIKDKLNSIQPGNVLKYDYAEDLAIQWVNQYETDISYLLNKLEKYEQALEEIENESSHEDGCLTQVNGIARDALKEE